PDGALQFRVARLTVQKDDCCGSNQASCWIDAPANQDKRCFSRPWS
ncbi:MAG: hypothetical protein ACI9W2_003543, partial [Gammaproteobacteria bacterium]